jgi:hypothetical protein
MCMGSKNGMLSLVSILSVVVVLRSVGLIITPHEETGF